MHILVHFVLALVAVSLLLMALLVLLLIQIINVSIADESRSDSDRVGEREREPNPSRTGMRIPDNLSAGGWPDLPLADQLPSPAGEPSADRYL
jgi:hypothetical protein